MRCLNGGGPIRGRVAALRIWPQYNTIYEAFCNTFEPKRHFRRGVTYRELASITENEPQIEGL